MTLRKMIWLLMNSEKDLEDQIYVRILHRGAGESVTYSEIVSASMISATGDIVVEASLVKRE